MERRDNIGTATLTAGAQAAGDGERVAMRILVYSDSPTCPTGFGTVVRNIFGGLMQCGFLRPEDVAFFGVNFDGSPHNTPFRVWPAISGMSQDRDPYGKSRFIDMVMHGVFGHFDVLFALLDHFSLAAPLAVNNQAMPFLPAVVQLARSQPQRLPFRVVQYIPVDSETVRPEWVNWIGQVVDQPAAYTEFGRRVLLDLCPNLEPKLKAIPHGTNPDIFFPVPEAERQRFRRDVLKLGPDTKLVVNVNRNQPRKDVPRTLQVFNRLRHLLPEEDIRLYCHMNVVDSMGFNLDTLRQNLHIPTHQVAFPSGFNEGVGVPVEVLNLVYNAADLVMTTARGEGWGLTVSEAQTAGACVLAPDHTSFSELLADGRGLLVPPEAQRQVLIADNDQLRPVADVNAMADAAAWALTHPEERKAIGEKARAWALELTWQKAVVPAWKRIFESLMGQQAQRPQRTLNIAA